MKLRNWVIQVDGAICRGNDSVLRMMPARASARRAPPGISAVGGAGLWWAG